MSASQSALLYARGWRHGAGVRAIDPCEPQRNPDWMRGFRDGRAAWHAAVDAERERLGLRPAKPEWLVAAIETIDAAREDGR